MCLYRRKKHARFAKDEIESSIGCNNFLPDDQTESFASPDTVCKFCGEDFKFFRALKHHLRTHSTCRQKPYTCRLCSHGFSTKANCIRHVQKQHVHVESNQLEAHILVSADPLQDEILESPKRTSRKALRAHLEAKQAAPFNSSPFITSRTMITSPPVDRRHLQSAKQGPQEEPLDLSRRRAGRDDDDQPIDLTVKVSPLPILITPVYRPTLLGGKRGEVQDTASRVTAAAVEDTKGSHPQVQPLLKPPSTESTHCMRR
jgi:hypothetical protein